MILHRDERVYYSMTIAVDPPRTGSTWQASFDDGATWKDGTNTSGDVWAWLVAGPGFAALAPDLGLNPDDTQAVISESLTVQFRVKDAPELDVEVAPTQITLV